MWSGVDHDVEIFASGVVTEDDGDWGTTEGTKEQAGAAAAGEKGVGHVRCGGGLWGDGVDWGTTEGTAEQDGGGAAGEKSHFCRVGSGFPPSPATHTLLPRLPHSAPP